VAFWCIKAELKMANRYHDNTSWLGDTTKLEHTWKFFHELSTRFPLTKGERYTDLDLVDPVWQAGTVTSVEVTKVFLSGHNPCLLQLTYASPIPPRSIMFKDDDIRPDMMVSVIFDVFNTLWRGSGLKSRPELVTFKVVPASPSFGFMEFVENSVPLREYDVNSIQNYTEEEMDLFLATAAGGYIGGFLLGIRDRHEDNLMIKDNNKFFQLDFKHAFNNKTFGIDGCRFAISKRLKNAIEARIFIDKVSRWDNFKDRTAACYLVLRRNSQIIIQLSRLLFNELFSDSQIELEMLRGFYLDRTEEQAVEHIKNLIEMGVISVKRMMKNVTHQFSSNTKPKT